MLYRFGFVLIAATALAASGCGDDEVTNDTPDARDPVVITSAACVVQADNVLRYDCTVETDQASPVSIEFRELDGGSRTLMSDDTGTSHTVSLWVLKANTTYEWWPIAGDTVGATTTFETGDLPVDLDITFNPQGTQQTTDLILFNYGCDGTIFLIIVNTRGEIVWYEDIRNIADRDPVRVRGFNVSPEGTILVNIDHDYVVEYAMSGEVLFRKSRTEGDFSASPHHEIIASGDKIHVLNADLFTYTDADYVMDGAYTFDRNDGTMLADWSSTQNFDPTGIGGATGRYWRFEYPDGIDYTHGNSLWVDADGNFLVSLKFQSTILKINGNPNDANFGDIIWSLVGDPGSPFTSDFTITADPAITTTLDFSQQHHAYITNDGLLRIFDNRGDPVEPSRFIDIDLDTGTSTAEIVAEHQMGEKCRAQSSAFDLPSGNILALCSQSTTFKEFPPETGSTPLWTMTVECATGGNAVPLYRAVPLSIAP